MMLKIFFLTLFASVYLLCKISVHVFSSFSDWIVWFLLLSFEKSLYILDTNPLLEIFSYSVAYIFIILTGSFTEQTLLILMKSNL